MHPSQQVNANLDLNHSGLSNSVVNLPVARELKQDLLNAINYCTDMTVSWLCLINKNILITCNSMCIFLTFLYTLNLYKNFPL